MEAMQPLFWLWRNSGGLTQGGDARLRSVATAGLISGTPLGLHDCKKQQRRILWRPMRPVVKVPVFSPACGVVHKQYWAARAFD